MEGVILPNLSKYQILPNGAIQRISTRRYLTWEITSLGYARVNLTDDKGVQKHYYIHRLVGLAYLDNPHNYNEINHKDENKLNNHFSNLEWCTRKYNNMYGTHAQYVKNLKKYGLRQSKPVAMCDMDNHQPICYFPSAEEASRNMPVSGSGIRGFIKQGNKKNHLGGYWWRYATEEEIDKYNLSYSS